MPNEDLTFQREHWLIHSYTVTQLIEAKTCGTTRLIINSTCGTQNLQTSSLFYTFANIECTSIQNQAVAAAILYKSNKNQAFSQIYSSTYYTMTGGASTLHPHLAKHEQYSERWPRQLTAVKKFRNIAKKSLEISPKKICQTKT